MSRGGSSVPERVVEAVADYTDTDVLDLSPLFDSIDPEALDGLIGSMSDGSVSFVYSGLGITVDSRGGIRLEDDPPPGNSEE